MYNHWPITYNKLYSNKIESTIQYAQITFKPQARIAYLADIFEGIEVFTSNECLKAYTEDEIPRFLEEEEHDRFV